MKGVVRMKKIKVETPEVAKLLSEIKGVVGAQDSLRFFEVVEKAINSAYDCGYSAGYAESETKSKQLVDAWRRQYMDLRAEQTKPQPQLSVPSFVMHSAPKRFQV